MKLTYLHGLMLCVAIGMYQRSTCQNGVYVISSAVGDGDYKEQQKVRVIPPNGKVSSSSTQGHLFIDKNIMILNSVASSPNTPLTLPQHDKGLPVGTIDGHASVDLNGSANYNLTLDVPPGTNGISPKINISYNHHFPDHQLGLGWSIGGLSMIRKENENLFADDITRALDPNCQTFWSQGPSNPVCPLYLDGNKLVPDPGASNTFYLENDNFSRITYNSTQNVFLVETKDGTKMEYGSNASVTNSVKKIKNNTKNYAWYLSKVYDNYGNYMEYYYHNVNNETAIKEIKYTGNTVSGQQPYNSVKFYYNYRVDQRIKYMYDDSLPQALQLREIETFCEGASVFRYEFAYAYEDFNYLVSVTKRGSDGSALNPTYFAYGGAAGNKMVQYQAELKSGTTLLSPDQDYAAADFNNDGKTDLIEFHILGTRDPNNGFKVYDSWRLFLNTGSGQEFQLAQTQNLTQGNYAAAFLGSYGFMSGSNPNVNGIELGDINGDGYTDLVYAIAGNGNYATIAAYTYDPPSGQLQPLTLPITNTGNCGNDYFAFRQAGASYPFNPQNNLNAGSTSMTMGDFNGDGKSELLTFFKQNNVQPEVGLFFFSPSLNLANAAITGVGALHAIHADGSTNLVTQLQGTSATLNSYSGFSAVDYNGDGRSDLIAYRDAGNPTLCRMVILEVMLGWYSVQTDQHCAISFREIAEYPVASTQFPADHASSGDFNGDGYLDFISHPFQSALESSISYGTGSSFIQNQDCSNIGRRGLYKKFIGMDVNDDGITDLVKLQTYTNTAAYNVKAEVILGQNIPNNVPFEDYGIIGTGVLPDGNTFCGMPPNKDYLHPYCDYDYDGNQTTPANCLNPNLDPDDVFDNNAVDIPYYGIGDFDGDGYNDILYRKQCGGAPMFQIVYFKHKYQNKFLTRAVNGLNEPTDFAYSTTAKSCYGSSALTYNYPNARQTSAYSIVSSMARPSAAGFSGSPALEITNYQYEDLVVNKMGRGLLGFQKVTALSSVTGRSVEQSFSIDPTYFIKLPVKTRTLYGQQLLQQVTNSYNLVNKDIAGNLGLSVRKRYQLHLTASSALNAIRNIAINSAMSYDNDGNLTQQSVNVLGKQQSSTSYNSYIAAGSWLPNKPQTVVTQNTYDGQSPAYSRQVDYVYDVVKGHCTTETNDPGDQRSVVNTYYYDNATGVLVKSVVTAPNESNPPLPVITTNTYDTKKRFVVTENVSSLNYQSSADYDYRLGQPIQTTAADGLSSQMVYDAFGRLSRKIDGQGNLTTLVTRWYTSADAVSGDPHPANAAVTSYFTEEKTAGLPSVKVYYDLRGREVKKDAEGFASAISNLTEYDAIGNVKKEYGPYPVPALPNTPTVERTYAYSAMLNDPTSVSESDGTLNRTSSMTYNYMTATGELLVSTTASDGKVSSQKFDKAGYLIQSSDGGGTITFGYHNSGQNNSTKLNGTTVIQRSYNSIGGLTQETQINSGSVAYDFDAFGRLRAKTDANGVTSNYTYDELGRTLTESIGSYNFTYSYVNSGPGKGQMATAQTAQGVEYKYSYDNQNRLNRTEEKLNGNSYISSYSYDNLNHLIKQVYPNGFAVLRSYNLRGFPLTIKSELNNSLIWRADEMDHFGHYTKYTYGNGLQTQHNYSPFGLLKRTSCGGVQDLEVSFDPMNGNLLQRIDHVKNNTEDFQYDALDRLTQMKLNGSNPLNIAYDTKGNITSKFDAGAQQYDAQRHNQAIAAANSAGAISQTQQNITYTQFDQPKHLTEGSNELEISYDAFKNRIQSAFWQNGSPLKTRIYLNESELELNASNNPVQQVNYISSPTGICSMQVNQGGNANLFYPCTDHLGSLLTITDEQGNVTAEQNFDAWGRRRHATTWAYTGLNQLPGWLNRGYTGHEMLEMFDLVNMNGRLYDPKTARMLSADPVLQEGGNTQNYNKYSYCLNNPLKYTDPSGYAFTPSAGGSQFTGLGGLRSMGGNIGAGHDGNGNALWGANFDGNLSTSHWGANGISTGPSAHLDAQHESETSRKKDAALLLGGQKLYYIATVDGTGKVHSFYTTLSSTARAYTQPQSRSGAVYQWVHGEVAVLGNGREVTAENYGMQESGQSGGGSRSGQIMAGALVLGAVTSEMPLAAAVIVAGGSIIAGVCLVYEKIGGKDGYHTTYEPVSENAIHFPPRGMGNPKEPQKTPNLDKYVKLSLMGALTYKVIKNFKEQPNNFNYNFTRTVRDNTFVSPSIGPSRLR